MSETRPSIVILAGPNGAGKSIVAPDVLLGALAVSEFVNAGVIASGLSAFDPDSAAFTAGRVMLVRIRDLAGQRASFAFETTSASRTFAPGLREPRTSGTPFISIFLWLSSADLAVERVAERVAGGGHSVSADTVRRRYRAGNFFNLYQPILTSWTLCNASGPEPMLAAESGWTRPPAGENNSPPPPLDTVSLGQERP